MISQLVLRLAAIRWLFKLGGLALLVPFAFVLKLVGIPLLLILLVLGFPILILLFLFGLPVFAVLMVGGLLMGLIGGVLTIGIAAIKFALFVVLPIWVVWKIGCAMYRWIFKRGDNGDNASPTVSTDPSDMPPSSYAEPVDPVDIPDGFDPAV